MISAGVRAGGSSKTPKEIFAYILEGDIYGAQKTGKRHRLSIAMLAQFDVRTRHTCYGQWLSREKTSQADSMAEIGSGHRRRIVCPPFDLTCAKRYDSATILPDRAGKTSVDSLFLTTRVGPQCSSNRCTRHAERA